MKYLSNASSQIIDFRRAPPYNKSVMTIRRATESDIPQINELLYQTLDVHYSIRPDIFKANTKKYTDGELKAKLAEYNERIFVAAEGEKVLGYAFCVIQNHAANDVLNNFKTLYIDDLCVAAQARGKRVGTSLIEYVYGHAKSCGCYNVTLNVWQGNDGAAAFYERCGFNPQKTTLEKIID